MTGCFGEDLEDKWKEKESLKEELCEGCEKEISICECVEE